MTFTTSTRAPDRVSNTVAPRPGVPGGIVGRAHEARLARDEHERLALVPGMVAEGDGVRPGQEQVVADRLGDAEAAGRVLAVDDDAVQAPALAQPRQAIRDREAPGPSDDVAEEEEAHGAHGPASRGSSPRPRTPRRRAPYRNGPPARKAGRPERARKARSWHPAWQTREPRQGNWCYRLK